MSIIQPNPVIVPAQNSLLRRSSLRIRSSEGHLSLPSASYRDQIIAAWRSSVLGIIKTGQLLIEGKAALPHGEFEKMIRQELPFQRRTAQMLMAVARHPLLSNAKHISHLPTSWSTLYELTKLPEPQLARLLESGEIRPETERKAVLALQREAIREDMAKHAPLGEPEACTLLHGDCWDRAQEIPEDSVDIIITDPPYTKVSLPVFSKLAQIARRCLKPGGSLVLMPGNMFMPEVIRALSVQGLNYQWTLAYMTPGPKSKVWDRKVFSSWKPLLWYVKEKYCGDWIGDVTQSGAPDKTHHPWGQSESGFTDIIERFTRPGQIILDPFLGGGTTGVVALRLGRRFIGIEIDEKTLAIARARMAKVGE